MPEWQDAFAIFSPQALRADSLFTLQQIVREHHPKAILWLVGAGTSKLRHVDFLITPKVILGAEIDNDAEHCRARLSSLGLNYA